MRTASGLPLLSNPNQTLRKWETQVRTRSDVRALFTASAPWLLVDTIAGVGIGSQIVASELK
jgi:hypothetical protein